MKKSDELSFHVQVDLVYLVAGVLGAIGIVPDFARLVWCLLVEDE